MDTNFKKGFEKIAAKQLKLKLKLPSFAVSKPKATLEDLVKNLKMPTSFKHLETARRPGLSEAAIHFGILKKGNPKKKAKELFDGVKGIQGRFRLRGKDGHEL